MMFVNDCTMYLELRNSHESFIFCVNYRCSIFQSPVLDLQFISFHSPNFSPLTVGYFTLIEIFSNIALQLKECIN